MHFPIDTLPLGAVLFAGGAFADLCDEGPFAPGKWEGRPKDDNSGSRFCDTKWKSGVYVTGVQAWSNKRHIKGLQLIYSDNTRGPMHGQPEGDWTPTPNTINWGAEKITQLRLAGNYNGGNGADAVGRINVETANHKLTVTSDVGSFEGPQIPVEGGIIMGISGKQGAFLDGLEWKILKSGVKSSAKIVGLKFANSLDDMNKKLAGIENVIVGEAFYKNSGLSETKTYTFENTVSKSVQKTLTHGTDEAFGTKLAISVGVGLEVPGLIASTEVSTEVSWEMTQKTESAMAWTDSAELKWAIEDTLAPMSAVHCTSTAFSGTLEDDYVATVEVTLDVDMNGVTTEEKYLIEQPGHFKSVTWTEAVAECKEIPLSEAPKSASDGLSTTKDPKREIKFRA